MDYDGQVNYIANPNGAISTVGWATYADAAGTTPVDGTGGSPASTFTRDTTTTLRGNSSLKWTKSAANRQGEGFSYNFTIDRADEGKILQASFQYNVASGALSYADDDMTVWVYDILNSVLIPVTPYKIKNQTLISDRFFFEFQTGVAGALNYRLIVHTASTSAVAYTLNFGDFQLGPQAKLYGSAITDWVAYTPTFTGFGTAASIEFQSRKVGDTLQIRGKFSCGTSTGTECRITLGFNGVNSNATSSDTTKIPSIQECGVYVRNISTAALVSTPILIEPSVGYITFGKMTATDSPLTKQNGNQIAAAGELVSLFMQVPIQGWGSSQVMSNDANTRIVAALVSGDPASATSGNPIIVPTVGYDSHGAYSNSTGRYTVPVPGIYRISGALQSASSATTLTIYKNAVSGALAGNLDSNGEATFTGLVNCIAGDLIDIRPGGTVDATNMYLNFEMLNGPAQIAASESINARYFASATSISGSLATINWTTKDFDSHTAMSSGTYTIPSAGKYQINSALLVSGTIALNSTLILEIQKNGTVVSRYTEYSGGIETNMKGIISDIISCLAGDTVRLQVSSSATGPAIVSSNFDNYFSISKVGN